MWYIFPVSWDIIVFRIVYIPLWFQKRSDSSVRMALLGFHWSVAASYLLHYSVFVLSLNNCCWSTAMFTNTNPISPDTSDWCRSSSEHGSAYDAALKYFDVDSIRSVQLNAILQNVFHKFGCEDDSQSLENNMASPSCVNVGHNILLHAL